MQTLEAIFTRRSVRKYVDEPISKEAVDRILEAGMYAPSAANSQPWHFIVVREKATLLALHELSVYWQMLGHAKAAIIVLGERALVKSKFSDEFFVQDCAAATQNMLLAAHELGIGCVWLGLHPVKDRQAEVRKLLGIPEQIDPFCVISMGVPAAQDPKPQRFREDRVRYEKW